MKRKRWNGRWVEYDYLEFTDSSGEMDYKSLQHAKWEDVGLELTDDEKRNFAEFAGLKY